jgi:hypothetical protein
MSDSHISPGFCRIMGTTPRKIMFSSSNLVTSALASGILEELQNEDCPADDDDDFSLAQIDDLSEFISPVAPKVRSTRTENDENFGEDFDKEDYEFSEVDLNRLYQPDLDEDQR